MKCCLYIEQKYASDLPTKLINVEFGCTCDIASHKLHDSSSAIGEQNKFDGYRMWLLTLAYIWNHIIFSMQRVNATFIYTCIIKITFCYSNIRQGHEPHTGYRYGFGQSVIHPIKITQLSSPFGCNKWSNGLAKCTLLFPTKHRFVIRVKITFFATRFHMNQLIRESGPILLRRISIINSMDIDHMLYKMRDEVIHQFPNFIDSTVILNG